MQSWVNWKKKQYKTALASHTVLDISLASDTVLDISTHLCHQMWTFKTKPASEFVNLQTKWNEYDHLNYERSW